MLLGICLTVTHLTSGSFTVNASPETLRLTNLSRLSVGSRVNLERSVRYGQPMGGHQVQVGSVVGNQTPIPGLAGFKPTRLCFQGHVDCSVRVQSIVPDQESLIYTFHLPESMSDFIVKKGYVALNGVSLTVTNLGLNLFGVCVILRWEWI